MSGPVDDGINKPPQGLYQKAEWSVVTSDDSLGERAEGHALLELGIHVLPRAVRQLQERVFECANLLDATSRQIEDHIEIRLQ